MSRLWRIRKHFGDAPSPSGMARFLFGCVCFLERPGLGESDKIQAMGVDISAQDVGVALGALEALLQGIEKEGFGAMAVDLSDAIEASSRDGDHLAA